MLSPQYSFIALCFLTLAVQLHSFAILPSTLSLSSSLQQHKFHPPTATFFSSEDDDHGSNNRNMTMPASESDNCKGRLEALGIHQLSSQRPEAVRPPNDQDGNDSGDGVGPPNDDDDDAPTSKNNDGSSNNKIGEKEISAFSMPMLSNLNHLNMQQFDQLIRSAIVMDLEDRIQRQSKQEQEEREKENSGGSVELNEWQ